MQRVRPEPNDTFSSQWVGVDGCSGGGLLQEGTESDSVGGTPVYAAWVELTPRGEDRLSMAVHPGDVVAGSISRGIADLWTISLADVTRHERFVAVVRHWASGTSAEWIEERSVLVVSGFAFLTNLSYFRVAKFGRKYTGSLADRAQVHRPIGTSTTTTVRSVRMLLTPGPTRRVALDRVGGLERDGGSFMVVRSKPFRSTTGPAPATVRLGAVPGGLAVPVASVSGPAR